LLSTLLADESLIATRKLNIRRFGASWIRPPGVGKTLQGMQDERAEREEQELAQARELAALEEAQVAVREGTVDGDGERDLDEDVPDADADAEEGEEWEDEMAEGMEMEMGMEIGDPGDGDVDEERDLDEDVPEAGSYEHTDTDVEEESSDGEDWIGPSMRMAGRTPAGGGRASGGRQGLLAGQAQGSSGAVGSSALGSSPAVQVGRRSGNFAGRPRGREN